MAVNFEIKGMLARLLATEDLLVEHQNVETACFNVHTRVLTLPLWEKASGTVYDMLVAHEVSHALYSPDVDLGSFGVPSSFINVVEDARVEKLIKRRYMGLSKTFYAAYKELNDDDFFCIRDDDVSSMNLADRVNLYFKIGNYIDVQFDSVEKDLVNEIALIETFEQTIEMAKKLYELCKIPQQEKIANCTPDGQSGDSSSSDYGDPMQGDLSDNQSNESGSMSQGSSIDENSEQPSFKQQEGGTSNAPTQTGSAPSALENETKEEPKEPEVKTADAFNKSIQDLINKSLTQTAYIQVPSLDLNSVIVSNQKVHSYISSEFAAQEDKHQDARKYNPHLEMNMYLQCDTEYQKFKKSAQREVNYLVKEFECRKSASAYSRALVSKTGVLDCSKIHTYQYCDDIFKKITTIPDGKNHGLIFILDWSGSMSNVLMDTLKQLYNLVWFCKKVSIPFDVYAFTGEWNSGFPQKHYKEEEGLISVSNRFHLMNFFTNNVSGSELEKQMKNIWRISYALTKYAYFQCPGMVSLSGTPLNESMIALHNIIPDFQKRNKVEKVQCVVLTDGEAGPLPHHVRIQKNEHHSYIGTRRINPHNTFLRDRKTGTIYKIGSDYYEFTDTLIKNLRDKFPHVNFIGMRIMEGRDAGWFIDRYCGYHGKDHDVAMESWKKNKNFYTTKTAYTGYFGISSNSLSQDSEFEVSEDATKSQIKNAFVKSLKVKKMNKKILGEFVQLVA